MPTLIAVPATIDTTARIVIPSIPCDVALAIGDWVRYDDSSNAVKSIADNSTNAKVIGVIESKGTTTTCNVLVSGVSKAIFSSLDPTKEYFLSPLSSGSITVTQPTGSGQVIVSVGRPVSSTKFYVKIQARTILS